MSLIINKSTLIFLLISIGLMVFPHVYHVPASVAGFFYFVWGWRFVGAWKPELLPNRWLLFGLMLIGIALLYNLHQGIFGRDAGTRLFVVALGLKLMELNGKRDLYLCTFLAFIVAASQFLYEQSVLMGGYILLVCGLLLATLVMLNSRKVLPWPALKIAAVIISQALPIAIVLFVLFPRFEPPRWALFKDGSRAKSGLSDSMEPGSISELGLSHELAFRVQFKGAMPPASLRYWRGPVLAYTDGKYWRQIHGSSARPVEPPKFSGPAYRYTLLMEPQDKNWVYALDLPSELPSRLKETADYRLVTSENPDKRAEYELVSNPGYNTGPISRGEYDENLQLPKQRSEKITRLVERLHGFDAPPGAFIKQVLNHFRQEDFHYSLTPPLLDEKQPLESFLFKTRYGFCSHYAAAFVYMMRIAHIPARVVTGYQGGEFNQLGGFLEIRQADAHAWAEVWLANQGWIRVDPTAAIAPERIEQPINIGGLVPEGMISFGAEGDRIRQAGWLTQVRQLWGNIDYSWQRWVINYNNKNQSAFLARWGIGDLRAMLQWLLMMVGVMTGLIALGLLWPKKRTGDAVVKAYQTFCKKLVRHGLIKGDAEGEQDFAGRAVLRLPKQAGEIMRITALFIRLRYGREAGPDNLKQLQQWARSFKVE